jgi:hypothetical protein
LNFVNREVFPFLILSATYVCSSLVLDPNYALIANMSWLLSIVALTILSTRRCSRNGGVVWYVLILSFTFLIFSWPGYIWSQPSLVQNYITHVRAEPVLRSYSASGKIVPVDEYSSFFLHYEVLYILQVVTHGSAIDASLIIYLNFLVIFLVALAACLLIKKTTSHLAASVLVMALLGSAASPAQLERGLPLAVAILWIAMIWFFSGTNRREYNLILILAGAGLIAANFLVLILLGALTILLVLHQIGRPYGSQVLPRAIALAVLCLWTSKITLDVLALLYVGNYTGEIVRLIVGISSFTQYPFYTSPGGSLSQMQQGYGPYTLVLSILNTISFACFAFISIFATVYCFCSFRKHRFESERTLRSSTALLYLGSLGVGFGIYISNLSRVGFWDQFGIFLLYIFMPALVLILAIFIKDLMRGKSARGWRATVLLSVVLFASLTSMLQGAVHPSGSLLTIVEFMEYGKYYFYKKDVTLFMSYLPPGMNVRVYDDSILASNLQLYARVGYLPLNATNDYLNTLPLAVKVKTLTHLVAVGNVIYSSGHQFILIGNTVYVINTL